MTRRSMQVALTGDLLLARPVAWLVDRDEAFQRLVARLQVADITYGNFESTFFEPGMPGVEPLGWEVETPFHSDPSVARDLRQLGIDVVGRANNHALDWGAASMRESSRLLDAAGVVHAGTGESLADARAPRVVTSPAGSIALVSVTTSPATMIASAVDPLLGAPGRAGVNALTARRELEVPAHVMAAVEALLEFVPELDTAWLPEPTTPGRRELLQIGFAPGSEFAENYQLDQVEMEANMSSVRLGAQLADHVVFAIHAHQGDQRPEEPREFLRDLARAAIGAGADIVVVTGPHTLGPIEMIEGRPVFYGIGNMFWQCESSPLQPFLRTVPAALLAERFGSEYLPNADEVMDFLLGQWARDEFFQAVVPTVTFTDGAVTGVELQPVRLARRGPCEGVPGIPNAVDAEQIIRLLSSASTPLGTSMDFDGAVGTVRL